MKLVFLPSTKDDLRWFKRYYTKVFPEGKANADRQFLAIKKALLENPRIGQVSETHPSLREFPIKNIPFTVVYDLTETEIRVLRLKDQRSGKSPAG